jgi:hypothetical protein
VPPPLWNAGLLDEPPQWVVARKDGKHATTRIRRNEGILKS